MRTDLGMRFRATIWSGTTSLKESSNLSPHLLLLAMRSRTNCRSISQKQMCSLKQWTEEGREGGLGGKKKGARKEEEEKSALATFEVGVHTVSHKHFTRTHKRKKRK